jgi:hypothetical protein
MELREFCNGTIFAMTRLQRHIVEACVINGVNLDAVLTPRMHLILSHANISFKLGKNSFLYVWPF